MIRVDAHQHYWHPARGDYDWMPADDPTLSRPYHPIDLAKALDANGISKTILVQAAATVQETEYLLGIADATPSVGGVVGWIDFEDRDDLRQLERLSKHPAFKGVRPMIQDIPDKDWMLRDGVQWAFAALVDLGLTFDALGFPKHLENFRTILTHYPGLASVIDHCMKPQISDPNEAAFAEWADGMAAIASQTSAFCKLSGLVTEAAPDWTVETLRPFAAHVLDVFGPDRVMWGSDWPVCRLRCDYDTWFAAAEDLTSHLDPTERAAVFGGNAVKFYSIS